MSDSKTVLFRSVTSSVDLDTGEVLENEVVTKSKVPKEPEFIKLYLQDILHLQDIPAGLNNVLYELLKRMTYDNTVFLNVAVKRIIAESVGCSIHTVHKAVSEFTKTQILMRKDTGIYVLNPFIFGKGEWKNIESIRATIEWTPEGKSIQTTVIKREDE